MKIYNKYIIVSIICLLVIGTLVAINLITYTIPIAMLGAYFSKKANDEITKEQKAVEVEKERLLKEACREMHKLEMECIQIIKEHKKITQGEENE